MKLATIAVLVTFVAAPALAQAPPKAAPKPTKADAQRVITLVSGDKAKTQTYCEIAALGDEIQQAVEKKDEKKIEALSDKADELGAKIGPEYVALMDGLQDMDPNSKESEEIGTMLDALDKLCTK